MTDYREHLVALGAQLAPLRREIAVCEQELRRLAPLAREAGVTPSEIARLVGVTRQTVYNAMKETK